MQEGNILLREDLEDPTIVLIDFEYCSYNYRGFDIANHFIEWIYDYTEAEHPNFRVVKENYPSRDQMVSDSLFAHLAVQLSVLTSVIKYLLLLYTMANANLGKVTY